MYCKDCLHYKAREFDAVCKKTDRKVRPDRVPCGEWVHKSIKKPKVVKRDTKVKAQPKSE